MDKIESPKLYTFPDALHRQSSARLRYDLPRVGGLVSCAYRCSVSSFWVGGLPWYLSALVLARPALLLVLCSLSGCAGSRGLHRRGI